MQNWILYTWLQQLNKLYAYSQLQYINAALEAKSPMLKKFLEERAFERLDFIMEIESTIKISENGCQNGQALEEVYQQHVNLYGQNILNRTICRTKDFLDTDFKIVELCNLLLSNELLPKIRLILRKHLLKVESARLSIYYLRTLYPEG
ncbi:hypothetical protein [Arenibacter latericius]|uniref:hypothetical protein n=1 Tax=Arenibacter latericius TaxID=86104 RepID=UPI0003FB5340|nr:hypothetical protein [Arenibacter latericius]MDX1364299.1 hypothetical protein [Arenibacter latericius]